MRESGNTEIEQISTTRQWYSSLAAAFGGFGFGLGISWTATALPSIQASQQISHNPSNVEKSLIGAILAFGTLIACLITPFAMNNFGRKTCMFYLCALSIPGWLILAAGTSTMHLCFGRLLTGIYIGGCTIVVPVYIKEISSTDNRGALGSFFFVMLCAGKLMAIIKKSCVIHNLTACVNFRNIIGILVAASTASFLCALQPALHAILILTIPESKNISKLTSTQTSTTTTVVAVSMVSTSGECSSNITFQESGEDVGQEAKSKHANILILPIVTAMVLAIVSQLCGVMVVTFFTNEMLTGDTFATIINPDIALVALTTIQLVGSLPTSFLVDRHGRRFLALYSLFAMTVSMAILSAYYYHVEKLSALYPGMTVAVPLVFLSLFNIAYSWGIGSVVFIIVSEIIPTQIIALISSLAYALYWSSAFLLTLLFQVFSGVCPLYLWFFIFCLVCLGGNIFVAVYLPETKGLCLDEIQSRFRKKTEIANF